MTSEGVFLVAGGNMVEMMATPYSAEIDLQDLLERHPGLLAGRLIDPASPRQWLLLSREKGVPDVLGGGDHWSADHLFVDQDGIPTIVEVKRSTNTQIRRKVVGQMLDYAANGVAYWPPESLREDLISRAGSREETDKQVADLLQRSGAPRRDVEDFWRAVGDNLRAGRLRLLFVADEIPATLQRIIEFLNEQMTQCEVLGLEIRQYVAEEHQVLAPNVIGRTSQSNAVKGKGEGPSFEELIENSPHAHAVRVDERLIALAGEDGWHWTTSKASRQYRLPGGITLCQLYGSDGVVEFYLGAFEDLGLHDTYERLWRGLSTFAGKEVAHRHPWVPAKTLLNNWQQFIAAWLPDYVEAHRARTRVDSSPLGDGRAGSAQSDGLGQSSRGDILGT